MRKSIANVTGGILVGCALVGYLTVADELRHIGEFFAVSGILVSGLSLLAYARYPGLATHLSLNWLPAGVGLGMLAGAVVDREVMGVCIGLVGGLVLARAFRRTARPKFQAQRIQSEDSHADST